MKFFKKLRSEIGKFPLSELKEKMKVFVLASDTKVRSRELYCKSGGLPCVCCISERGHPTVPTEEDSSQSESSLARAVALSCRDALLEVVRSAEA